MNCQVIWLELEGGKMKLSTKGRYGLKTMFQLAYNYGKGPISLKSVAEEEGLSENYLEQLVAVLKRDGLLQSVRGAQGGYMLSKHPKDITVGSILRSLEGNLAPAACVIDEEMNVCEKEEYCVTRIIWQRIRDSIYDVIDSITLQDMIDEQENILQKKKKRIQEEV